MNMYRYITYFGRDRDDWTAHYLCAPSVDVARDDAHNFWAGTGQTVKNNSFQVVDNE